MEEPRTRQGKHHQLPPPCPPPRAGYGTKKAEAIKATKFINTFKSTDSTSSLFWSKVLPYAPPCAPPLLAPNQNEQPPPQPQPQQPPPDLYGQGSFLVSGHEVVDISSHSSHDEDDERGAGQAQVEEADGEDAAIEEALQVKDR